MKRSIARLCLSFAGMLVIWLVFGPLNVWPLVLSFSLGASVYGLIGDESDR